MVKVDINGNTVSKNRAYCMDQIRTKQTSIEVDSVSRVMVNLDDGGYIAFFSYDEPRFSANLGVRV